MSLSLTLLGSFGKKDKKKEEAMTNPPKQNFYFPHNTLNKGPTTLVTVFWERKVLGHNIVFFFSFYESFWAIILFIFSFYESFLGHN